MVTCEERLVLRVVGVVGRRLSYDAGQIIEFGVFSFKGGDLC